MKNLFSNLLLAAATLLPMAIFATSYTWNGGSGNWSDASNWTPNGVPGAGDAGDDVVINSGTATLTAATTIQNLEMNNLGTIIDGNFDLTIAGTLSWSQGEFGGTGTVSVLGQATLASGGGKVISAKILSFAGGAVFQTLECTVNTR